MLAVKETGNPVFTEYQYGKGKVFFLNMPVERYLSDKPGVFNNTDWYKIYQQAATDIVKKKVVVSTNPQIGVTLHKENEEKYIVCAINYSDTTQDTCLKVQEGWKLTPIYGNPDQITKCNGAFFYVKKA